MTCLEIFPVDGICFFPVKGGKKAKSFFVAESQALPELQSVVQLRLHLEVPFLLLGLRTLKFCFN